MNVLLVEDDQAHAEVIRRILRRGLGEEPDVNVMHAPTGHRALVLLDQRPVELILLDYSLPDRDGLDVLEGIRDRRLAAPVIFLTAADSAEVCARAFKGGATDYVVKKPNYHEVLVGAIASARASSPTSVAPAGDSILGIVGESEAMIRLREAVSRAARVRSTVLLEGETGTGKELVARAIHDRSRRAKRPFVVVNCAAIPDDLFESEVFGCVRGAFTGAVTDRVGLLESAHGGTFVLDEIEALSLAHQAKLLRALQSHEFRPVGSTRTAHADVRVVAATNESLEPMVDAGLFRRDLFFRLDVVRLRVPPLRERGADVAQLARHFVRRYNERNETRFGDLSPEALAALTRRPWPGNVRELENVIERTLVNSIEPPIDEREILGGDERDPDEDERREIVGMLTRNRWNREQTARELGLSRVTLWRKMTRLGLVAPGGNVPPEK